MPFAPEPPALTLTFEKILGWMGCFTPQFKFQLQFLQNRLSAPAFTAFLNDAMVAYRSLSFTLSELPPGPERARRTHAMLDQEFRINPVTNVTCAKGCSACCRIFPKQITADEGQLLAELIINQEVKIDLEHLAAQAQLGARGTACPFLNDEGACGVYQNRPAACRKYHVTSPAENCADPNAEVLPVMELMPELITSAALGLPNNEIGYLSQQVMNALAEKLG